jgi:hypothetical protein
MPRWWRKMTTIWGTFLKGDERGALFLTADQQAVIKSVKQQSKVVQIR